MYIKQICENCNELITDPEVPMDTKLNCGIFLLLKAKLFDSIDLIFNEVIENKFLNKPIHNLCLCFGIINTISETQLDENNGYTVLRHSVINLKQIASEHAIEQNVLIGICRALVQLSKTLLIFKLSLPLSTINKALLVSMTSDTLNFVWTYAIHYMDNVRYLSKDLLKNLLKLSMKYQMELGFLAEETLLLAKTLNSTTDIVQCMALDFLCQIYGAKWIIEKIPTVNQLLMKNLLEPSWAACYERLLISHSQQIALDEWYILWVQPILGYSNENQKESDENASLQVYENLISCAIKSKPEVIRLIIAEKEKLPVETYLYVMLTVRKTGSKILPDWKASNDTIIQNAKVTVTC